MPENKRRYKKVEKSKFKKREDGKQCIEVCKIVILMMILVKVKAV